MERALGLDLQSRHDKAWIVEGNLVASQTDTELDDFPTRVPFLTHLNECGLGFYLFIH